MRAGSVCGNSLKQISSKEVDVEILNSFLECGASIPAVTAVAGGLFALSEILALVPNVQSNSVFQLIQGLIKKAAKK